EDRHPRHAGQPRPAVDLHRARAALAGLAVPADGQVARLGRLQPVQDVQHDLALIHLDLVVGQVARARVAPPDLEVCLVTHVSASPLAWLSDWPCWPGPPPGCPSPLPRRPGCPKASRERPRPRRAAPLRSCTSSARTPRTAPAGPGAAT